jgi:hypothetical protein
MRRVLNAFVDLGIIWPEHVACTGERRGACRILVGKTEGRRPLETPRRRWEDNIKTDF